MLVPAVLMVSTIRFRSFKTIDLQARRSYKILLGVAIGYFAITTHPRWTLVALAYSYLASAFVGMAWSRLRRSRPRAGSQPAEGASEGHAGGADGRSRSPVPRPRSLVTAIVPLFSSTLRRAIDNPSPVPTALVEK